MRFPPMARAKVSINSDLVNIIKNLYTETEMFILVDQQTK